MQDSLLMKDTSFILNKKENERLEKDDFVPYLKLDCFNDWYFTDQENQEEMSFETLSNRMLTMDLYVTLSKKRTISRNSC